MISSASEYFKLFMIYRPSGPGDLNKKSKDCLGSKSKLERNTMS